METWLRWVTKGADTRGRKALLEPLGKDVTMVREVCY